MRVLNRINDLAVKLALIDTNSIKRLSPDKVRAISSTLQARLHGQMSMMDAVEAAAKEHGISFDQFHEILVLAGPGDDLTSNLGSLFFRFDKTPEPLELANGLCPLRARSGFLCPDPKGVAATDSYGLGDRGVCLLGRSICRICCEKSDLFFKFSYFPTAL